MQTPTFPIILNDKEKVGVFCLMIKNINKSEIQLVMENLGYGTMDIEYIMEGCAFRFSSHMKERSQFPHELGLLLGYPVADVVGFMENCRRKENWVIRFV